MRLFPVAAPVVAALCLAACSSSGPTMPPPASPTWSNFAQGFFSTYCVSCHSPGGAAQQQDFDQLAVVQANAALIRCGVAPASIPAAGCSGSPAAGPFPIGSGPKPTDAERSALVHWIDLGAPM